MRERRQRLHRRPPTAGLWILLVLLGACGDRGTAGETGPDTAKSAGGEQPAEDTRRPEDVVPTVLVAPP